MADILDKMDPDKRHRLINSAMKEFGNNTYAKASTNAIVKEAGISKGLLYHYFDTKEALYNYLMHFMFNKTANDLMQVIDTDKTDLLDRLEEALIYKIKLIAKYPSIIDFSKNMYLEKSLEDIKAVIDEMVPGFYHDFYYKNVDYTLFKEDVDVDAVIKMIQMVSEKLSENYARRVFLEGTHAMEDLHKEFQRYMIMWRQAFYK